MTTKKAASKPTAPQAVLVTTQFRGVFFGHIKDDKKCPEQITLTGARNCIYWAASVRGFMGLAKTGPNRDCRISASVPEITLYSITSLTPCGDAAVSAWEKF